jgi:DNA-binding transcriptional regulator YhcF (GntR family)
MAIQKRLKQNQSVIGLFRAVKVEPDAVPRHRPFYRRLVELVERGIARHELNAGFQLPPERDMARSLRVSRATVVAAYRELEARGLVRAYVGRGTFVCARPDPGSAPFSWRGKVSAAALQSDDATVRDLVAQAADPGLTSFAAGTPGSNAFRSTRSGTPSTPSSRASPPPRWKLGATKGSRDSGLAGDRGRASPSTPRGSPAPAGLLLARCSSIRAMR